jgi:uncharacterized membrane protein
MECPLSSDGPEPINHAAPHRPPAPALLWAARGVAAAALGIALYFLWASVFAGGQVAGCGDNADVGCSHVLSSRWSQWLRLPVSLPAAILYALTLLALFGIRSDGIWPGAHNAWRLLVVLAVTLLGSALWFLGIQVLVLGSLCVYCVTAHICGILLAGFVLACAPIPWRRPEAPALLLLGLAGTAALIAGQLLVTPRSPDLQVRQTPEPLILDVEKYPLLGSVRARYFLVELYDYTCPHCRATSSYLEQARRRYGNQLAILPLVVPLHPGCNKEITTLSPANEHACELARLALAVWRTDPRAFETFHLWLMEAPKVPEAARQSAAALVGADALAKALADDAINRQLEEHVRIYAESGKGQLPRLVYGRQAALGQPADAQQLFDFLEKTVGLRPQQ